MASKRATFGENRPPTGPFNLIYECGGLRNFGQPKNLDHSRDFDLRGWGGREKAGGGREVERHRNTEKEDERQR